MSLAPRRQDAAREKTKGIESEVRELARGRAARTPFELMGVVAVVVWLVAGMIAGAVLLVWWLV